MAKLSSLTSSNLADLQMAVLVVFSLVAMVHTTACSTLTQFTMYDPQHSEVPITCRNCSTCPPGHGLPKDCGDKVPYGTPTDCVPCKPNQTYSKNNDSSTCRTCHACEKKIVLQECTTKQDRICGPCFEGHYLEPHLDVCKECHFCCPGVPESQRLQQCKDLGMPRNQQCEDTEENKKCKIQAEKAATSPTSETRWNNSTKKIRATTSTTDIHKKTQSVNRTQKTATSRTAKTDEDSKSPKQTIIGVSVGGVLAIILLAVFGILYVRRHRKSSGDQGDVGLPLRQFQAKDHLVNSKSNDSGRTTPSSQPSQNPSTASSCTSSVENISDGHRAWLTQNIQCIPAVHVISDMEWLRDSNNELMVFYVQSELDPMETVFKKTWRSVGLELGVSPKVLEMIKSCYVSQESPTGKLIDLLKGKAKEQPTMREFAQALISCGRNDVAETIIKWPWELAKNHSTKQFFVSVNG